MWWRNLLSINNGGGEGISNWFYDHLRREVGDEVGTLFWWDALLVEGTLKSKCMHLFYLSINKMATKSNMFLLGWGDGGNAWRWRRRLWAWEEELISECCVLF